MLGGAVTADDEGGTGELFDDVDVVGPVDDVVRSVVADVADVGDDVTRSFAADAGGVFAGPFASDALEHPGSANHPNTATTPTARITC